MTLLEARDIVKIYPNGVLANDHVHLSVEAGEIHAVVGENGAGKSTLMKLIYGLETPTAGEIRLRGQPVRIDSPQAAITHGIGMVHQNFMLVPNLTVTENVALGLKKLHRFMNLDLTEARRKVVEVSAHHELPVNPDAYIWQLSVGEQQRVELIKTLCFGAQLLILDEPTSALTPQETDDLIDRLKRMTAELSIIFISQKLNEVKELSNRVAILRHGPVVFNGQTVDHSSAELAALMTGREVVLPRNEGLGGSGEVVLSTQNLRVRGDRGNFALDGLDLDLRAGEILGLAGVSGNGQRELAEALTGLRRVDSGAIRFHGKDMANRSPASMICAGLGYIPEDRHHEGIVPSFTVKENLVLKDFFSPRFSWSFLLRLGEIGRNAESLKEQYDIRCSSTAAAGGSLSGGNIQKVILARELARDPEVLVAVYPTRGVDMGAEEFIHSQILARRREGGSVLLISEELDEIMNLSDRIAVIYKGRILKVLPSIEATRERLGLLMAGVADE